MQNVTVNSAGSRNTFCAPAGIEKKDQNHLKATFSRILSSLCRLSSRNEPNLNFKIVQSCSHLEQDIFLWGGVGVVGWWVGVVGGWVGGWGLADEGTTDPHELMRVCVVFSCSINVQPKHLDEAAALVAHTNEKSE